MIETNDALFDLLEKGQQMLRIYPENSPPILLPLPYFEENP